MGIQEAAAEGETTMKHTTRPNTHGLVRRTRDVGRRSLSALCAVLIAVTLLPSALAGPSAAAVPVPTAAPVGQGFNLNPSDLKFILQQIKIAEHHATTTTGSDPCRGLLGNGPNQIPAGPQAIELPWGLRTVDGTCNNLVAGKAKFGAADQTFPTRYGTDHREAEARPDIPGFPPGNGGTGNTTYAATGNVYDSRPRDVSNLIVDQTASNPAAVAASGADPASPPSGTLFIQNVAPDVGLSAPFNSWFTLFGQFFDHGLDLVNKGPSDTVFVPLAEDDPLFARTPPNQRFLVLTRATGSPGATTNQTATFVDQSQTYASHPAHQVFLREYAANAEEKPVSTGKMLEGTLADGTTGGLATWAAVKEQARTLLGIELDDMDALSSPLIATDPYGEFLRGDNGYPLLVRPGGQPMLEGNPQSPIDATQGVRTGHAFLDDIAHTAAPRGPQGQVRTPDDDATPGGQPPAGRYDDELLAEHFVAGDGRINENIGLTAVHHVFHAEHNRLAGDPTPADQDAPEGTRNIKDVLLREDPASVPDWQIAPGVWDGERIFQAAKFVTEMEYQHLAFEEFARKVQPMVNLFGEGGSGYDSQINPAIRAEFAHAVYRFGHSMLTETVARREAGGGDSSLSLIDAFLSPTRYDNGGTVSPEAAAGRIVRGMTRQTGNEIDEFVTDALRNNLLGLPLDLATINMVRARETGVKRLNHFRAAIHAESNNPALAPYSSWTDFGFALRNRDSLVNFVAAYGKHPSITGTRDERRAAVKRLIVNDPIADPATPADADAFMTSQGGWTNATTGLNDVDLWVGGLAEKPFVFGGLLGSTFNYIFESQMEDLQFGDRFYYLSRTAGLNLLTQLEGNSFAELIHRTTDVSGLPADSFSRPDYVFNVGTLMSGPTSAIVDDLETDYNEADRTTEPGEHLTKSAPAGTFRYTGPAHVVANGTSGDDRIWTSEGDDTIRGGEGKDWMQGGDGVDNLIGGDDDDILNDTFGDDTLKGGDGDDALSSGQGFAGDLNQGGRGKDFIVGGNDGSESFAGPGDDFVFAGDGQDTVFGDDGDDWIEGGKGPFNLLQGDNGAPFQNDPNAPGHDVIDGDGGEQDFDSEGGDDIMLMGPGVQRAEGMLGFDWTTHKGDPEPGDSDMDFTGALPPSVEALRDRFDLVEGLSGWDKDDVLRGDSRVADDIVAPGDQPIQEGHALGGAGIDRIAGLQALLGSARSFSAGNIILGGDGSDTIEGRGGDDIIDGDRWLNVRLTAPEPGGTGGQLSADSMRGPTTGGATTASLETRVFAGNLDPGNIVIVREVLDGDGAGTDRAVFTNNRTAYTCADADGPLETCPTTWNGDRLTVTDPTGVDGTDTLTGIEELVFSDSVPPGTPTDVTAVRGNESVQLSFTPPPNPVDGFEVRVFSGTSDTVIATRTIDDPDAASFLFPNLVNGVAVSFEVRAINGFGPGEWSARSNVVTPAPGVPGRPDAPAAAAGNGQVSLSWAPPADNGGAVISQYAVRVRDANGNQVGDVRTTNGTSMVVDGLTNETAYSFAVRATNSAGNGPFSLDSLPVTPTARTAPAAPRVTTVTPANARVSVTWAPGADGGSPLTGFSVRLLDSAGLQVGTVRNASGSARSMVITGLSNGTRVRAQVLARNAIGQSAWSTPSAWVTPATVSTAPRSVSATAGSRSATVRWVRPASTGGMPVLRYRIQVLNSAGRQVGALRIAGRTARQLRVTGLAAQRAYRFRVQAGNERGYSAWSTRSNVVRPRR